MNRLGKVIAGFALLTLLGCQSQPAPASDPASISPPTTPSPATVAPEAAHTADLHRPGSTFVRPTDGMTQMYAPAGTFMMGSAETVEGANPNEMPQHPVQLDAFWIDQTEVSVAQFRRFVEETGHVTTAEQRGGGFVYEGAWRIKSGVTWEHPNEPDTLAAETHPVTQVSWGDAVAYCKWAGGNLPTEAQWEYAARGSKGTVFPWGDDFDNTRLNFCDTHCTQAWRDENADDGYAQTSPVGGFPDGQSWIGALDMAGNVWEWVRDWQGEYPADLQMNPTGPDSGSVKVLRGGGWVAGENSARSVRRGGNPPDDRGTPDGFRCVSPAST